MTEQLYALKLTRAEVWALEQAYESSFTDPESKNAAEVSVTDKLMALSKRARPKRRRISLPFDEAAERKAKIGPNAEQQLRSFGNGDRRY